jgi:hypothetical protein
LDRKLVTEKGYENNGNSKVEPRRPPVGPSTSDHQSDEIITEHREAGDIMKSVEKRRGQWSHWLESVSGTSVSWGRSVEGAAAEE